MRGHSQLRKGQRSIPNQVYHVTTATSDWRLFFEEFSFGRAVVAAIRREHDAGHVESLAFTVMPDHLHWLFSLRGDRTISGCVRDVKRNSARTINEIRGSNDPVWQPGFYDRAIRRNEDLVGVARYIIANPLRAGLVRSVRDYPLWDAKWL